MAYAETTTVPVERSIGEIIGLVKKAGAIQVGQMEDQAGLAIVFRLADRAMRFTVSFPSWEEMPQHNGRRQTLSKQDRQKLAEQRARQRARALLLVIKAKLESVESGVETFEEAFLANIVMADKLTVYERISAQIAQEYKSGAVGPLMLEGAR